MRAIFEDDDLLVVSKPSGLVSHPIGDGALGVAAPPERVGEVASANGIVLHELTTERATLEEVFLSLTDSSGGEGSVQ